MVVPPELELEAELLLDPLPDLVVTEGPPVVALLTPPGPAVTELDIEPVSPAPSAHRRAVASPLSVQAADQASLSNEAPADDGTVPPGAPFLAARHAST
ncbi:hypothetical protein OMR07_00285 [Methylobacterium organophilum]|nr:hypothetical protein [Methylobacterium organophilum]